MRHQITGDGSHTYLSDRYQQTYHSSHGAQTEARHVFLQTSGIAARLGRGQASNVLELGFGLGLNYLLTADLAQSHQAALNYAAVENDLISPAQFNALQYDCLLNHPELATDLSFALQQPTDGMKIHGRGANTLALTLQLKDIEHTTFGTKLYDAVYLDAFSPEVNPECWTPELFSQLQLALKPEGVLATYCVKGTVRRALEHAGFGTERLPGPPGKREILRARINS